MRNRIQYIQIQTNHQEIRYTSIRLSKIVSRQSMERQTKQRQRAWQQGSVYYKYHLQKGVADYATARRITQKPKANTYFYQQQLSIDFVPCKHRPDIIITHQIKCTLRSNSRQRDMVVIACQTAANCPFLFDCIKQQCVHQPILPPTAYSMVVYILIAIGVAFCNVGGLSGGALKVPFLMDMLDYTVSQATTLSYPIVTGGALANFLQLIPKRHPTKDTSLVDYNIVLILLPSVIYGSTLGVFVVKFIPQIYQDAILMTIFSMFTVYYMRRWRAYKPPSASDSTAVKNTTLSTPRKSLLQIELSYRDTAGIVVDQDLGLGKPVIERQSVRGASTISYKDAEELQAILEYEKTHHVRDIAITILVFGIFEVIANLVQGKIIHFSMCEPLFIITFSSFTVLYFGYVVALKFFTNWKMAKYKRVQYDYDIPLDNLKNFMVICLCSLGGGFMQGVIGIGSGTCIVTGLLTMNINQKVASGTSGFIVLFVGLSSLIEAIAQGELTAEDVGWFMGLAFIVGGTLTLIFYRFLLSRPGATKTVMLIVALLSLLSVLGTIPSIILTNMYYGWAELIQLRPFC